jgi:type 1 glutamine amidotransferase
MLRIIGWFAVVLLCFAPVLSAQSGNATISGRVKDASGAVMPGAIITAEKNKKPSRRLILNAGIAALATAGSASSSPQQGNPRAARVLFLVGDYHHNGAMQAYAWRNLLKSTGWRLMFAQSPSFITPEVMADADLYVLCRYASDTQPTNISLGWSPEKIVETRPEPDVFMSPEHEAMIVKNVRWGMGLVAVHCAIWNPKNQQYLDLMGVEKPIMHGPVVPAHMYNLNQDHPITKGLEPFDVGIDEVFDAVMKAGEHVPLFRSKQETPARDAIGGCCRQEGTGRAVALLPGHTTGPYGRREFVEIMWRSAHWALKREIPAFPADVIRSRRG